MGTQATTVLYILLKHQQSGSERAGYGEALLKRLAQDLRIRLGCGFSERNIRQMRQFYLGWPNPQTVSAELSTHEFGRHRLPNPSVTSVPAPVVPLCPAAFCGRSQRTGILRA